MAVEEQSITHRSGAHGAAFLLSQLGAHSSRLWNERMAEMGMDPRHVVLLRLVAAAEGNSQHALGEQMQLPPSRMVSFVDELESRGMLVRRSDPEDRRVKALYLTDRGREILAQVGKISAEHEALLCTGLGADERKQLIELLGRMVSAQGLTPGVHPGVAWGGRPKN